VIRIISLPQLILGPCNMKVKLKSRCIAHPSNQQGFSLVEIMVGLIIGLLVTLVVVNVFRVFEQQKRVTTGNSDAQTNGAIALYNMQRDLQQAGYGLPVYSAEFSPFNCPIGTGIDHDNNLGTPAIGLSPVLITNNNGANGSDTISVRFGNSMKGGIAVPMVAGTAANIAQVNTNIGCSFNDIALVVRPEPTIACNMTRVGPAPGGLTAAGVTPVRIVLNDVTNVASGSSVACLGAWSEVSYTVAANQLTRAVATATGVPGVAAVQVPTVPDVVNIQAQYGISASANSNQVVQWVEPTGAWANTATTPTVANRGLCAWDGAAAGSPAPVINLAAIGGGQFRYRVYESIIPIRNIIWSRTSL
jgi:type IV pilus assembly protein PilW